MLGDNAEKSKNPLKKAIRRRNTKTVQFAAPTYFEASDIDYSSEEEEGEGELQANGEQTTTETRTIGKDDQDEITVVEPLKIRSTPKEVTKDDVESGDASKDAPPVRDRRVYHNRVHRGRCR